jgi:hypothetical protein
METKITAASVRVNQTFNYSNFEVSMTLENPEGINNKEIDKALNDCQVLANDAVAEYKVKAGVIVDKRNPATQLGQLKSEKSTLKRQV